MCMRHRHDTIIYQPRVYLTHAQSYTAPIQCIYVRKYSQQPISTTFTPMNVPARHAQLCDCMCIPLHRNMRVACRRLEKKLQGQPDMCKAGMIPLRPHSA